MLLDNFFKILSLEINESNATAKVELNAQHKIYDGHFPGMPVTPGVCIIQMFTETLEKIVEKKIRLLKGDQIKFLSFIEPLKKNEFNLEIKFLAKEEGQLKVTGELFSDGITYFKFKGAYIFL